MITSFKNVLVLAPHTDDGELGAGGTIAKLIEGGAKVTYAAFSTAAESVPDGLPKDILEGSLDVLIEETVLSSIQLLEDETILDDEKLERVIVRTVRAVVLELINKKPEVTVLINRLVSSV